MGINKDHVDGEFKHLHRGLLTEFERLTTTNVNSKIVDNIEIGMLTIVDSSLAALESLYNDQ